MGIFSDKSRRMADAFGVLPEHLSDALDQSERERQARTARYEQAKAIIDAHDAGQPCGGDCAVCRSRGLI